MSSELKTSKKRIFILILILLVAAYLRFYNLRHDAPYFFDPDERNMASSISQFRLPAKLSEIPICLYSQFIPSKLRTKNYELRTNQCNLNPHFFAYGQFPLYLAFTSDQIIKFISSPITNYHPPAGGPITNYLSTSFPSAIFWLRFYSALSSTLTVLLVFFITKKLLPFNPALPAGRFALLISVFAAFTPGLIQAAHFGTTESLLTFFFLASIYLSLRYHLSHLSNLSYLKNILLLSLVIGLAVGSKLTGLFFFIPPFLSLMIRIFALFNKRRKQALSIGLLQYWVIGLFILFGSIFFYILSSPYNLIDREDFRSAVFGYEADVALGQYEAFYTRQFVNTIPVLFQIKNIFPYALGLPIFILGSLGFLFINLKLFIYIILSILRKVQSSKWVPFGQVQKLKVKNILDLKNLDLFCLSAGEAGILIFGFWIYFLPNAFLFAKWTRFMTPILPFFAIFSAFALFRIYSVLNVFRSKFQISNRAPIGRFQINIKNLKIKKFIYLFTYLLIYLLVFITVLPGVAFMSIYLHEDVRVTASRWIYKNIPSGSYILFETGNVVDIPLGIPESNLPPPNYNLTGISFDYYHIDENRNLYNQLMTHLSKADYIFIPSRRIFANYPRLPDKFPLITKYYQLLFSGALGFEKVIEITSFPSLGKYNFPDEQAEETYTVFDHPVIRIYRKVKPFTKEEYKLMFES